MGKTVVSGEWRVVSGDIVVWLRNYHDLEAVIEEWERTLGSGADSGRETRNGAGLNGMAACAPKCANVRSVFLGCAAVT